MNSTEQPAVAGPGFSEGLGIVERAVAVGVVMLMASILGWAVWTTATKSAQVRHCNEMMNGIAVREGQSGRIVCVRRDGVLKVYE